ncbi:MAG: hypothetical protein L0I79_04595, partial [Atopostipes sp.]|nr:hypothetical protein [Atopostipes sp.]
YDTSDTIDDLSSPERTNNYLRSQSNKTDIFGLEVPTINTINEDASNHNISHITESSQKLSPGIESFDHTDSDHATIINKKPLSNNDPTCLPESEPIIHPPKLFTNTAITGKRSRSPNSAKLISSTSIHNDTTNSLYDNKYQRTKYINNEDIHLSHTAFHALFGQHLAKQPLRTSWNTINLRDDQISKLLEHVDKPAIAFHATMTGVEENQQEKDHQNIDKLLKELGDPPKTFKEAMKRTNSNQWLKSLNIELDQLEKNHTWTLVKRPKFKKDGETKAKILKCRWVLTYKFQPVLNLYKLKARLVLKGYEQQEGIDFDEVYAPTVRPAAVRLFFTIAALWRLEVHQMDVCTAFLNGELEEELYMAQPPGFEQMDENGYPFVCKLNKSIYGLKQAPRCWYKTINKYLITIGFNRSEADNGVYIFERGRTKLLLCLYVDDLLLACNDQEVMNYIKEKLNERFEMKDMGLAKFFLGVEIVKMKGGFILSQKEYIGNILKRFGNEEIKPRSTPADEHWSKYDSDKEGLQYLSDEDKKWYQQFVGSLHYLVTWTRPDLATVARILSQKLSKPTKTQINWAYRVMQYLKGTTELGLEIVPNNNKNNDDLDEYQETKRNMTNMDLVAYSDADFANGSDRKSITGFIIYYCGCPISWKTKKQNIITLSTTEAELYAAHTTIREGMWLKRVVNTMIGKEVNLVILEDNKSTISLAKEGNFSERTKHIGVALGFVNQNIESGVAEIKYVGTNYNVADAFTKPLGKNLFLRHRGSMLNKRLDNRVEVLDSDDGSEVQQ